MPRTPHGWRTVRVTLEGMTSTTGESGFPVETFTALGDVWAYRAAGTATELLAAAQLAERIAYEWRIPFRADCDPDVVDVPRLRRLVWAGRVHDVVEAGRIDGRKLEIRLVTREKVTGA
jgi:head-tail adaptor